MVTKQLTKENDMYDELIKLVKKVGALESIGSFLSWDQHVMMPDGEKAMKVRSEEMGALASVHHVLATSSRIGDLLEGINRGTLDEAQLANVREIERNYERAVRVPNELIEEKSKLSVSANQVWVKARKENNFAIFEPFLKRLVEIKQQIASSIDPNTDPYQVLFEEYEPGMTLEQVDNFFREIKEVGVPLIKSIKECPIPDTSILKASVPEDIQLAFNKEFAKLLGYDFENGRLDTCVHPMTCGYGRITTRFTEGWWSAVAGTIHEAGHGKYEHNLLLEHFGTPLGYSRSLGVHESQSRLWENHVGLSDVFWRSHFPILKSTYGEVLKGVSFDKFYRAINVVQPGYIRVDADELTYTMHIILRYEIEKDLIEGKLAARDIPDAWNVKMKELLGIVPPTDSLGCLQDIHWTDGSFGYFPTYTIGSMIAAQLWSTAEKTIPDFDAKVAGGDFNELNSWLEENIHQHGCRHSTNELVRRATGKKPSAEDYTTYLTKKFTKIYDL